MQTKAPLFDKPFYKDWIFWLALLGVIAGVSSAMNGYNPDEPMSDAMVIDVLFAISFQFGLFGIVPASIRIVVRNRKAAAIPPVARDDKAAHSGGQNKVGLAARRDAHVDRFVDSFNDKKSA